MVEVGLLIAFGVLMGAILNQTGAIRARSDLLNLFGTQADALHDVIDDRDAAPVDLSGRAASDLGPPGPHVLRQKIGKLGTASMAAAMAIGLECGIVFTVPGVASLAWPVC